MFVILSDNSIRHFDWSRAEWRNLIQLQEIYSPEVNAFASLRSPLPSVGRNDVVK